MVLMIGWKPMTEAIRVIEAEDCTVTIWSAIDMIVTVVVEVDLNMSEEAVEDRIADEEI